MDGTAELMALILAALWSAGILAILCAFAFGTWKLFLWMAGRGVERVRTSTQAAQINALHAHLLHLLELEEKRKKEAEQSVFTGLDGKRISLNREEQRRFHAQCQHVLGLGFVEDTTQQVIRQHWRKQVLSWHPDQGGDPALWLVRQRAYDALMKMAAENLN